MGYYGLPVSVVSGGETSGGDTSGGGTSGAVTIGVGKGRERTSAFGTTYGATCGSDTRGGGTFEET